VAVVVTAASGYDLGYVWKNQAGRAGPEKSAGGYYINAAQVGEPPGRWSGPGGEALGFADGQVVERRPYEMVYRQLDPRTGAKLGRSRGNYATFADHLARLRAAEPHATTERLLELGREAAQATRQAPAYTDMTVSLSKSISVFHASIRENERRARLVGDLGLAARWAEVEARYQEAVQAANRAGLEYVQHWAGMTRTGHHGTRVHGQEAGRFEEALITVSSWLQGTSRDGDPQDHVHNQIARLVKTVSDGKWRALDTVCLRQVLGAVQAIVATHVECGLKGEFGVEWVARTDGRGNEIVGITQSEMDAYSSRTVAITEAMPAAVASWTAKYGRAPNERELLYIRQEATLVSRHGKEGGVIDWDALTEQWDAQIGGALASVALRVSPVLQSDARVGADADAARGEVREALRDAGPEIAPDLGSAPDARLARDAARTQDAVPTRDAGYGARRLRDAQQPAPEELTRAVQQALTLVQAAKSTWTRSDLLKQLALVMPPQTRSMLPGAAVALLHKLADEALAGSVEEVVCLEAPLWPPLPEYLRRPLDGRSVYTRPGTTRYATRVQLTREEQLLQHAQRLAAPHLTREEAAAQLGADAAALEAQLTGEAQDPPELCGPRWELTEQGLRADQATALYHVLTSARTVEVIAGPAGSGKTRTLAAAARAWTDAGKGEVLGIATAQAARNVLAEAGVMAAENSAVFLGHLAGRRGARGIRDIGPGTLLVIDEASMMSIPDLLEIVAHADRRSAKVIVAGDHEQLTAIESGGGMMLLARRLGYVQLTEAVRFAARWEQEASLRLRTGDVSALDDYDEHGRIRGADPEQAMDDAVGRYVAHHLAGRDALLMACDRARCRELSRRIRDDLIHLGLVNGSREVALADGARASVGDLIICRRNDHAVEAGDPGRTLANGDLLRIEAIRDDDTLLVRRALDCDWVTGSRRWTDRMFAYSGYGSAELGYAVTGHSAQGRSVQIAIPVVTGAEDRQWLYVAMTRGAESNTMIVFTQPARVADAEAGTRPAPELARHRRVECERAGLPALETAKSVSGGPEPRDAIAVAADILGLDGSEMSALETHERALSDADHLALLNAMWQGETAGLQADRYRQLLRAALPAEYAADELASPQATWLWRTLRSVEAAGRDPGEVVRQAMDSRSLAGARDLASVIDARIRRMTDALVPQPQRPWSEGVPVVADPERLQFLTDLAAAMVARKERIGEHLAEQPPAWAVIALGGVPEHPLDRLAWQRRAAEIGAYRELYGFDHPDEPIGPEPAGDSPEKRAAWHSAFTALGPVDGIDLRALPDGSLLEMRATYAAETAWAPRHVGRELRAIRASADDADLAAIRAQAEERIARQRGQGEVAARHGELARSYAAMEGFYREHETELEQTMQARRDWDHATEESRRLAIAADAELRRRHPGQRLDPLRSLDPVVSDDERGQLILTPGADTYQTPAWISELASERRAVRERLGEPSGLQMQGADAERERVGEIWPVWSERERAAILQAPKPEMRPAPAIHQRAADLQPERS
jgi:hypothetical protein